ncbi:MAG: hypothetical protein JW795_13085 [Chitinivibrionales bacterium]|nr:hypothetical protein [Chitinivibrionales bacterium]
MSAQSQMKIMKRSAPEQPPAEPAFAGRRTIALHTLSGVIKQNPMAKVTVHPFSSGDGLGLTVTRFCIAPTRNVVLLIHGLTSSSDMFIMPEHTNIVSYLLQNSFTDIWCLDCRISNRFPYNLSCHRFSLDDVAMHDIPAALSIVRTHIDSQAQMHVITHCVGSIAFMMALFGKTVTGIRSAICNSVTLHPRVPKWSLVKLFLFPSIAEYLFGLPYINPQWSRDGGWSIGKIISGCCSIVHRECANPVCHMLSFMWGAGAPALFNHANLDPITHDRLGDLFGGTSMNYYRHIRTMVLAGRAVKYRQKRADTRYAPLPDDYCSQVQSISTPVLFIAGSDNRVFPDSNKLTHAKLAAFGATQHEFHEFEKYGHQDIFMGKNAWKDIFPRCLEFLRKHMEI